MTIVFKHAGTTCFLGEVKKSHFVFFFFWPTGKDPNRICYRIKLFLEVVFHAHVIIFSDIIALSLSNGQVKRIATQILLN